MRTRLLLTTSLLTAFLGMLATLSGEASSPAGPGPEPTLKPEIPYVPTRHEIVRDLLWMADVSTNDVVYDLGSGDGRVVIEAIRHFGARRAVGVELSPDLVRVSRSNAVAAGVADRVEFLQGDLFASDFAAADVLVIYLGTYVNLELRSKIFRSLRPGSRVVSHQFGMGEWARDKAYTVRSPILGMYGEMYNSFRTNPDVPDFDDTRRATHDEAFSWIVPARVAGTWKGKLKTEEGEKELKLILHQRLSRVSGTFEINGASPKKGWVSADLWGRQLRCRCMPEGGSLQDEIRVQVEVTDNRLSGAIQGTGPGVNPWQARREPVDYSGTWEWTGLSNAPVQLRIERAADGQRVTYTDKNRPRTPFRDDTRPITVRDFYDFGGGFYFTLLLGLEGESPIHGSRHTGPMNGWLIGEAAMEGDTLTGTLAFYPYPDGSGSHPPSEGATSPLVIRQKWTPKRVAR